MKIKIIICIVFCILTISCTRKQIPFNKQQWINEKNRFYMTDSLIEKLNNDKPGRAEIFDILGKPEMEGWIRDSSVHYLLKSEDFLTIWVFDVYFDSEGNFESANIHCED